MRVPAFFALLFVAIAAGCAAPTSTMPAPLHGTAPSIAHFVFATNTPAPNHLYLDHNGIFFEYRLPLRANAKPIVAASEEPGAQIPPVMTADQFGRVAIATPTELLFFRPPITSFAPSKAYLTISLTPAITEIGQSGAVLADVEWDPNENFWLLNNIGGEVTMLPWPLSKRSVATVSIAFGQPGTKTAAYTVLSSARFDVNATLYVLATAPGSGSMLFKSSYPYAKAPSPVQDLDLSVPDFVDPSQFPNGPPISISDGVLYGQYLGPLYAPPPQRPPPVPVDALAQFSQPFVPNPNVYPDATIDVLAGALVADANRGRLYVLDASDGSLRVYPMPFANHQRAIQRLRCPAPSADCDDAPEHVFLAP
ncbi:MAG TPA: hypothetical protein VMH02_11765 [Verrucomicrobiae bacterium]|nr:hypothetical protein [Verrucomicrobiae bacterium]